MPSVPTLAWRLLAVLSLLTACEGTSDPGPAGRRGGRVTCVPDQIVLGTAPMRRLSNVEYLNTLSDLFPGAAPTLPPLPADAPVAGFENDAASLGPSDVRIARYEEIAFIFTRDATADDAALARFTGCAAFATDPEQQACAEQFVDAFGLVTHRRPLEAEERTRYLMLFDTQRRAIDFRGAIQLVAMAMLQGPYFIYRLELSPGAGGGPTIALSDWELATRMSYFLWQSMPDQELLDAAAAGELSDPMLAELHARRMIEDPRAAEAVIDFHRQWLELDRIYAGEHATRANDPEGVWTASTQASAHEEMERFIGSVFEREGTLSALLTSRRAFVNRTMAGIYGVEGPADDATFLEVDLPAGERAGVLTRVSTMASHAHAGNPSPPLRGVYVMTHLLCDPPEAAPAGVDLSPPTAPPGSGPMTNRQLFDERTARPACSRCHTQINGIGYGFEHYDERGVYLELDESLPVDATGTLEGTDVDGPYDGAIELSERMADSRTIEACATERFFRFAAGRAPELADTCVLGTLRARFHEAEGDMRELMVALITSPELRARPIVTPIATEAP